MSDDRTSAMNGKPWPINVDTADP